ncbi:sulfite exporter TauE/SafE family protein [Gordonia sp. NPDC003424]
MIAIAIALGLLIGLSLGALGGGGSILTVPALVYLLDQPLSTAITQSLIIVGISSASGVLAHAREGRVQWPTGIALGVVGGVAAWGGTAIGRHVPSDVTLMAFSVLMVVVAVSLLLRTRSHAKAEPTTVPSLVPAVGEPGPTSSEDASGGDTQPDSDDPALHPAKAALRIVVAGIGIGLLTGFFGVGGGFVIVPALVLFLGYSMPTAVGTSLLVITINSAVALGSRIGHAPLDWAIIAPVAISAIAGSYLGKRVAQRFSDNSMTRAFAVMLIAVAAYVAARSLGILPG